MPQQVDLFHCLATLKQVDKIIVLEHGKIVEQGTFEELIKQPGVFQIN